MQQSGRPVDGEFASYAADDIAFVKGDDAVAALIAEYRAVRAATVSLLESFTAEVWRRRGIVNGYEASVRGP